jgi:hypothetical protein
MLAQTTTNRPLWRRTEPEHTKPLDHLQVVVHREWNGWRTAMVEVGDLEDVHWFQPKGAPRPLIHAYVQCTRIRSGEIEHDCHLTAPPHTLLVCILKSQTASCVFEKLSSQADERWIASRRVVEAIRATATE